MALKYTKTPKRLVRACETHWGLNNDIRPDRQMIRGPIGRGAAGNASRSQVHTFADHKTVQRGHGVGGMERKAGGMHREMGL